MDNFKPREIVSGVFATTVFSIIALWCTGKLEGIGSFLSGIGTIGLFFLAVWQIPKELEKNRNQRHLDRVTDIAFELSESTIHFINSINHLINRLSFKHEILDEDKSEAMGPSSHYTSICKVYRYRLSQHEKEFQHFYDTSWKVHYLRNENELNEKFEALKKILWNLSSKIHILKDLEYEEPALTKVYYNEFLEVTSDTELEQLKKDILMMLAKNFD